MAVQLSLPLGFAPQAIREHGLRAAHVRPRVGCRSRDGGFWTGRVPASHAWAYPYIETGDAGATWATLVYDCDDREAMQRGLADLPPYNWAVWTPRGAHLTYCLAVPVGKHDRARAGPERWLAATAEFYHATLGADPAFSGLGRNPAHPDAAVTWGADAPYSLADLSSVVPFGWRKPRVSMTGIGRNRDLFMATCRGDRSVPALTIAHAMNREVADRYGRDPLPDAEVAAIARSVERYRRQWERQGHSPAWLARQAARGRKGGQWRLYEPGKEPWALEGVSRATWFRRRKAACEIQANTDIPPEGGQTCSLT